MPLSITDDLDVRVTSTDRSRRRSLPRSMVMVPDWTIDQTGGYADASVPTTLDFTSARAQAIQIGDCVEIYVQGNREYRGYVIAKLRSVDNPRHLDLSCLGAYQLIRLIPVDKTYAFPFLPPPDIQMAFRAFAFDYLDNAVGPNGARIIDEVQALPVGTTLAGIDANAPKLAGDVIDILLQEAGNLAVAGVEVNEATGRNRLYFRPFAPLVPPTHMIPVPSRFVTKPTSEENMGDLASVVVVTGAALQFPQLEHNGDFRLPVQITPFASLIVNGDFESGAFHVATGWALGGGATPENGKDQSPAFAHAYAGDRYLELDHVGENAVQVESVGFAAGDQYVLTFYAAKEIDLQVLSGTVTLLLKDAGGTTLATYTATIAPLGQAWEFNVIHFVPPAGAAQYSLEFNLDSIAGWGGQQGGLIIDSVEMYDVSQVYQDGWALQIPSDVTVNAVNWTYTKETYEGPYCLYLDATVPTDADFHGLGLVPASGIVNNTDYRNMQRFRANGGQQLRYGLYMKSPTIGTPNPNFPAILVVIDWFDGSGTYISQSRTEFAAPGGTLAAWTYKEILATAPSNAVEGLPRIFLRSTGSVLLDAISLRDAQAPSIANSAYQREGNLLYTIASDDPYLCQTYLPGAGVTASPSPPTANTAGVANPTVAPVLTAVAANPSSPFLGGVHVVGYTWVTLAGETQMGPTAVVSLAPGQAIGVGAIGGEPAGVTAIRYYVSPPLPPTAIKSATPFYLSLTMAPAGASVTLATLLNVPAYFFSRSRYGARATSVSSDDVIDLTGACSVAHAILTAKGLPSRRPGVELLNDTRPYWAGESVSLQGTDGPSLSPSPESIVRIKAKYDGILRKSLEMQRIQPDPIVAIKKLIYDVFRLLGPGGSTSAAGTAGSASSPAIGGGGGGGGFPATIPQFVPLTGTIDGTNQDFTLPSQPTNGYMLFRDNLIMDPGTDYSADTARPPNIHFSIAPQAGGMAKVLMW